MLYTDLLEQWPLVEYDFQAALGIDLRDCFRTMPWRRFTTLVAGLLCGETLLNAQFRPPPEPTAPEGAATFD